MSARPESSPPVVDPQPPIGMPALMSGAGPLSWPAIGLILLFGASLYGFGLVWPRTLTFHETIFAQPAREMVATGNWLVPRYAGQVWDDKPPLTCWLIAGAMRLFHSRHEAVVHLPNILVTLGAALLVATLTARWYGSKVGLLAGLVQLTTFYTLMQGRLAEADMPLGTAVLGAMTVFALANIDRPGGATRRWWMPLLFYFFAGLAFLTKGPIGPAFVGLACGLFALWQWERRVWRFLLDPLGWAVFLVMLLAWPLAVWRTNPEIVSGWLSQNVGRFSGKLAETGDKPSFFLYFYMIPMLLLPWTPTLLWGLWSHWRGDGKEQPSEVRSRESGSETQLVAAAGPSAPEGQVTGATVPQDKSLWRFLFCWFIVGFVLLHLSDWKWKHYAIPILFAATPIIAWRLWQDVQKYTKKPVAVLAGGFAGIWVICVLVELLVQPHFDDYKYNAALARRINRIVPAGETIYFWTGDHRPHLAYYLERPMQVLEDQQALEKEIKQGRFAGRYLITQRIFMGWFKGLSEVEELDKTDKLRPNEDPMFRQTLIRLRGPTPAPATQAH